MKIFNIENDKKVVYVQMNDLAVIMNSVEVVPAVVVTSVFAKGTVIIDDSNRNEFVRFDDETAVSFFEEADWIVDFKKYYKLSEKELIDAAQEIQNEMDSIASEFNSYKPEERKEHMDLRDRHELLEHKFYSLPRVLWFKQGHITIPFPEVIDSTGFVISSDDVDNTYIVRQGLNPYQAFLYRNDGKELDEKELPPRGMVQSVQSLLIMNNMNVNEFLGDFEQTNKLSDDKKYLITTIRVVPKEEKEKEKKENNELKLTFGKRVKNALNKFLKG